MQPYDAIIVGSGACGGWAAMELTRKGMKVLMLEAGANIEPHEEFRHRFLYEMDYRGRGKPGLLRRYAGSERNYRIMIDNLENPYTTAPDTVYRWGRSRCLGGRTVHWARATDRMGDYEFKAASLDGYGVNWPIGYADIKPYYDRIESFIGVSGSKDGWPQLPDGPVPAADAAELRRDDLLRGGEAPGLAGDAAACVAADAPVERAAALPLLRQLRERL
jgi:choline dehydrogenase-like flavoprotein